MTPPTARYFLCIVFSTGLLQVRYSSTTRRVQNKSGVVASSGPFLCGAAARIGHADTRGLLSSTCILAWLCFLLSKKTPRHVHVFRRCRMSTRFSVPKVAGSGTSRDRSCRCTAVRSGARTCCRLSLHLRVSRQLSLTLREVGAVSLFLRRIRRALAVVTYARSFSAKRFGPRPPVVDGSFPGVMLHSARQNKHSLSHTPPTFDVTGFVSSSAPACHGDHEEGFEHAQT